MRNNRFDLNDIECDYGDIGSGYVRMKDWRGVSTVSSIKNAFGLTFSELVLLTDTFHQVRFYCEFEGLNRVRFFSTVTKLHAFCE